MYCRGEMVHSVKRSFSPEQDDSPSVDNRSILEKITSSEEKDKLFACTILSSLTAEASILSELESKPELLQILKTFMSSPNFELQHESVSAIKNLVIVGHDALKAIMQQLEFPLMAMQLMVSLFSSPNVSYSKEHLEFIGNLLVILWTFAEDFELPIIPGFVDILFLILCAQDEAICETKVLVLQLLYCLCDSPSYKMALQNGKLSVMASLLMQPQAEKCFINSSSLFQLLCRAILECVSVDAQQKEVLKSEALFCISKALEINELDLFEKLSVEVNPRSLTDAQASMIDEFCFHLEALKTALQILTNISAGDDQGDEEEVEDWDEDEDSSMCVDQDDCKSLTKVIQELKIFELILLKIPRISEATFAKFHGSTCLGQFISLWDELQELFLSAMANIAALPSFSFPSDFQVEAILASLIQGLDSKYPQRVISTLGLVRNIVMKQSGLAIESLSTISQLAASTDNPEIMSICLSILGHCCKSPEMLAILTPLFPTMNQILQSCESPSLISSVLNTIFDIFGVDENDVAFRQLSILPVLKDCHSKLSSKGSYDKELLDEVREANLNLKRFIAYKSA